MCKNFSLFLSVIISLFFLSATSRVFADAATQLQQAEEYLKNKQYEQAEQVYKQIIAENPGTNDALQAQEKLTCLYVTQGKEPEAQAGLQKLLTDFSQYNGVTTAVTHVADEYRNLGRNQRAIEIYQQVVSKWPGDEHAMWSQMGIAISNASIGNDSAAEAAYAKLCADYSGQQHISRAVCLVADNYRRLGKHKKAQDIYRYALGLPSAKPDAEFTLWSQMGLAISSLNLGDEVAASQAIEKLRVDFAKDNRIPIAICLIADEYRKFGRHNEACELYQYVVGNHPNAEHALWSQMGLAISNICLGDEDAAQKAVDRLRADFGKHPDLPEALYTIAGGYSNAKKFKGAEDVYKQLIEMFPDSPYAEKARFRAPKIHIFYLIASGKFDEVQAAIDKFVADFLDNPDVPGIIYWFAKELELSKEYEKAKSVYQQVAFDYPDNPHSIKAQLGASKIDALLFIESEQDTAAQKTLDNLIANFRDNPDLPEVILLIGEEYFNKALNGKGKPNLPEAKPEEYYRKALAVWERIVTELPKSAITPEAYFFSTRCYHLLGEYEKAIGCCKIIVDNWPHYQYAGDAQFLIGECYEHLCQNGNISENEANQKIIKVYSGLVDTYPDFAKLDEVLLKLGWLTLKGGDFTAAEEFFARALERFPEGYKPKDALYALARIYQKNGKYTKAEQAYTKLLEYVEPDSPEAKKVIAMIAQVKQLQN